MYDKKKFKIMSPFVKIPFGPENFGRNLVLNLELINYDKNNDMYNFISIIRSLDTFLLNSEKIGENNVQSLSYLSSIKDRPKPYYPLLRTNIKKYGKKIITETISKCNSKTLYDVQKGNYVKVLLELDNIWMYNGKYGINWSIDKIYL
jgi:hypothetical protein